MQDSPPPQRGRIAGRPRLRILGESESTARRNCAAELDRRLRALSGRASRCRLVEGWLAADLLSRRGWRTLGFVRLGDFTRERLGIGARTLEEQARIARSLQRLPRITRAFLDGTLTWTAVRLVAGVALPRDEERWIEQATTLDTRALAELVRKSPKPPAADPEITDTQDDPSRPWSVRVSRSGRRLWRAACELAERAAGSSLTQAQVLEQVAAEAASGGAAAGFADPSTDPSNPELLERARSRGASTVDQTSDNAGTGRNGLAALFAADLERRGGDPSGGPLPFLTLDRAREIEERDPLLASFYVDMLTEALGLGLSPAAADEDPAPPAPEAGWFETLLAGIGEAEGFTWLKRPATARPCGPAAQLWARLDAMEAAEPYTVDVRLREVRRAAQAVDFELAGLLREAADRRLYREFRFANLEQYVEARLGICARTAWSLLAIERATRRCCTLLGEAWREGRVSSLAARILVPVVGAGHGREWIARAEVVTLRRLEAEVAWALDRRDRENAMREAAADPTQAAGNTTGARTDDIAPPPLDHDLANAALAGLTAEELQKRAQAATDAEAASYTARVQVEFSAPESIIRLAEETMLMLRCGSEPRGLTFERMLATAMLEWIAAPAHRDPVFERDGWRCAVPGCRSRRNLHDHHLVFRSLGGGNARDNRVTVCAAHHLHGLHRGRIRAGGEAPHAIRWELGCRFGGLEPMARLVGDRYVV